MEQEKKYGQFVKEMPESDTKKTWEWLRKAELKIQTESLLCVAQEHAFRITLSTILAESITHSHHLVGCVKRKLKLCIT